MRKNNPPFLLSKNLKIFIYLKGKLMDFKTAYGPKLRVQVDNVSPSRTKQAFKDECDINTIISRFLRTGVMNFTAKNEPRYGDCTGIEFDAAMRTVANAQSLFNELPAALRHRFENEPAKFLDFVQDEKNREEATALGLLKPVDKLAEAVVTPPVPAPAPEPAKTAPAPA